ncbi:MAG: hypothetical protein WAM42_08495 [Candidatus Nitrosopolaris sp.]
MSAGSPLGGATIAFTGRAVVVNERLTAVKRDNIGSIFIGMNNHL